MERLLLGLQRMPSQYAEWGCFFILVLCSAEHRPLLHLIIGRDQVSFIAVVCAYLFLQFVSSSQGIIHITSSTGFDCLTVNAYPFYWDASFYRYAFGWGSLYLESMSNPLDILIVCVSQLCFNVSFSPQLRQSLAGILWYMILLKVSTVWSILKV